MQPANCLNCGATLTGVENFCPNCGQKAILHRLTLKEVGHDTIHYFTHADKGIFSLLKDMAVNPGKVPREFVAGKRKKHFPPLNFILLVAALCLFMTGLIQQYKKPPGRESQRTANTQVQLAPAAPYDAEMARRGANVGKFFAKYSNLVTICAIPLFSFLMWLLYSRQRYTYTEHLVANMYIGGFSLLVYALVFLPLGLVTGFAATLYLLFEFVYRIIAYYYFINKRTTAGWIHAALVSIAVSGFWVLLSFYFIRLYIRHGLWGLLV